MSSSLLTVACSAKNETEGVPIAHEWVRGVKEDQFVRIHDDFSALKSVMGNTDYGFEEVRLGIVMDSLPNPSDVTFHASVDVAPTQHQGGCECRKACEDNHGAKLPYYKHHTPVLRVQ